MIELRPTAVRDRPKDEIMTTREALLSMVETLDDEQVTRLLGYADALRQELPRPGSTSDQDQRFQAEHATDPLIALIGAGRSAEPTNVAKHKDAYLAEAFEAPPR